MKRMRTFMTFVNRQPVASRMALGNMSAFRSLHLAPTPLGSPFGPTVATTSALPEILDLIALQDLSSLMATLDLLSMPAMKECCLNGVSPTIN
eukprot:NODE_4719_length_453_cov_30.849010_g4073_i0.p1 GENE.NODE_4719_length_453_cov_30.849010_g4073_i0~~NODE_4719_length_453_cov_30.849010_g4073_i0.p1  ORF type:complete len:107 (+),score=29.42 NODE_4719_length_453_cov_30.849010_g4073_i0:44-322(+)